MCGGRRRAAIFSKEVDLLGGQDREGPPLDGSSLLESHEAVPAVKEEELRPFQGPRR